MTCVSTCIQPSPSNAHCSACHVTFGSVSGFDRHRRDGACLDPETLAMHRDRNGIWRMDGQRSDLYAPSAGYREPQTAEIGPEVPGSTSEASEAAETISDSPEVWSDAVAPGGYVCAVPDREQPDGICGMPVEDEPCSIHALIPREDA